jgi:hypothetical protein
VPSFRETREKLALRNDAEGLRLLFERGVLEAQLRREDVDAVFNGSGVELQVLGNKIGYFSPKPTHQLHLASGRSGVTFYPTQSASPSRITLTNGSYSCDLTVSLRGRINENCY